MATVGADRGRGQERDREERGQEQREQRPGQGSDRGPDQVRRRLRVAAYGVCVRDGHLLLSHWIGDDRTPEGWTMPGGGVEHGEDPFDAVIREVEEETGYRVAVDRLLGIDSFLAHRRLGSGVADEFQGLRIIYLVHVVGGDLRDEVDGSTDRAAWVSLDDVPALERVELVDIVMRLYREQPPSGHVTGRTAPTGRRG
jgi:8-oxo-dGTP pyrophosphatase MutT (NUDIX family)